MRSIPDEPHMTPCSPPKPPQEPDAGPVDRLPERQQIISTIRVSSGSLRRVAYDLRIPEHQLITLRIPIRPPKKPPTRRQQALLRARIETTAASLSDLVQSLGMTVSTGSNHLSTSGFPFRTDRHPTIAHITAIAWRATTGPGQTEMRPYVGGHWRNNR